jgi:hypothetical protein
MLFFDEFLEKMLITLATDIWGYETVIFLINNM